MVLMRVTAVNLRIGFWAVMRTLPLSEDKDFGLCIWLLEASLVIEPSGPRL